MTTGPGTRPGRGSPSFHSGARYPTAGPSVRLVLVAVALLSLAGCGETGLTATPVRASLVMDQAAHADLDGDGSLETVVLSGTEGALVITDGEVVYRSRDRWWVAQACIGDTNGDGRAEVLALLDAGDGRHLGLFSYFAGEYRERLVTREFDPAPVGLEVVDRAEALGAAPAGGGAGAGDIVVLVYDPHPGESEGDRVLLRWNGFSFTSVEGAPGLD